MLNQHLLEPVAGIAGQADSSSLQDPTESDDSQLIQATLQGDAVAYGSLVHIYQDRLCNSLMNVCRSYADAQDAAQEAFVRAYVKLDSFLGTSKFYVWLYRIALNVTITEYRRRRMDLSIDGTCKVTGVELPDQAERPDQRLLRKEQAVQVQKAMASLRHDHRTILVLREIDGCDYDEIARTLSIPVGTVRSRLHRARLQLRAQLTLVVGERVCFA